MNRQFHYGYVIVACCFLIMFLVVGLAMSTAGIFFKPVSEELGVELGELGLYMSLNFLFSTLTLPLAGRMMARYSGRWILTVCSVLVALAFFWQAAATHLWQFYVAGAMFGSLLSFLLYLSFPIYIGRWFKSRVGLFIGICSAGSGLGGMVFNPIAGHIITNYGWRTGYASFGLVVLLVVAPVLAILMRDYPSEKGIEPYEEQSANEKQSAQTASNADGIGYRQALRMPIFYALILMAFLMNAVALLNVFLPAYASAEGFSIEQGAWVVSAVMAGVTIGKVGLGYINDRSVLLGAVTTTGLGIVGLLSLLFPQIGQPMMLWGGFLFGWAYAGVSVQMPILVRHVFGQKDYAAIYSNISMAFTIGGCIGSGAWGFVADHMSYSAMLLMAVIFLATCLAIGVYSAKIK